MTQRNPVNQFERCNPDTNILPSGIDDTQILEAVIKSGYPLQTIICEQLSKLFYVWEEWSFIDRDLNQEKSIDLLAQLNLFEYEKPQKRIRPTLNLILNCKRSDFPYIFFLTENKVITPNFPLLAGVANKDITISSDDTTSRHISSILQTLGLDNHSFLTETPIFANTFSQYSLIEEYTGLSDSKVYQDLIFPLLKAVSYFDECEKPPKTAHYFDCHLTVPIIVIDAPMVSVKFDNSSDKISMIPWVRIPRHQIQTENKRYHLSNVSAVDVVHKDFFEKYINDYLMPFANDFAKLALKHDDVIADGKGFVSGMEHNWWENIETRIMPCKVTQHQKKIHTIFQNIVGIFKQ